jgi:predicted transposase YbfD/YdcC
MKLQEIFAQIPDPRIDRRKLHLLDDILLLTLLAVICGAESYEAIELFGKSKLDFLKQILELPNGIPSHDTLERVFKRIDGKAFETAFIAWIETLGITTEGKIISIDGKTVRGSQDEKNGKYAIHLVSAWCSDNQLMLGQIRTASKSNEIKAVQQLLDLIDVEGGIITIDAMGCQRDIATKIIGKKADYILAVKQNQETLYNEIAGAFAHKKPEDEYVSKFEGDHGRIEQRTCSVIHQLSWIEEKSKWMGIKSIVKVEATREVDGESSTETRFYIASIEQDAYSFNQAIRQHWGIENNLHWTLDVQFREDESRKRKGQSAENFAIIRRIALMLLKNKKLRRLGVHNKRLVAGWDHDFLLSLILN